MRPPGALDGHAVDDLRSGPSLRCAQDDHRPARPLPAAVVPGRGLDSGDLVEDVIEGRSELLVDGLRLIAGDQVWRVAVALQQRGQFLLADAGQHSRVGDLVPVEMEDRQDRAVADRVDELGGVPRRGQRPGLRFSVSDDTRHDQVRVVECRSVGVRERVPQLTALVDRSRHLRRHVTGNAAGKGELLEQPRHPAGVLRHCRVPLAVRAFQPGVRHDRGTAVARPRDVDDVEASFCDDAIEVRVDEIQARGRPPMAEQAALDVLRTQRLTQQRVRQQVDLAYGEVVRGPPVGCRSARARPRTTAFRR